MRTLQLASLLLLCATACGGGDAKARDGGFAADAMLESCEGAGSECSPSTCAEWGACENSADACAADGIQSRTCDRFFCRSGLCTPEPNEETQNCTRNPEGNTCLPDDCPSFGACAFEGDPDCDTSGVQTRDCLLHTCASGSCTPSTVTQTQSCTRATESSECGTPVCDSFTACVYDGDQACDQSGSRTRNCTPNLCASETCSGTGTSRLETDTDGCARTTNGSICFPAPSCTTRECCLDGECGGCCAGCCP